MAVTVADGASTPDGKHLDVLTLTLFADAAHQALKNTHSKNTQIVTLESTG